MPDFPNGFCLFANIAIAIEAARSEGTAKRFAVIDWDVHHGNGTEAIFYDRDDVFTVSIHQDRNYPTDRARIASGLTQAEPARRVGIHENQIQKYEATDYQQASLARLRQVEAALPILH